jgi:multidrug efflux system membrane fusion protein
MRKYVWVVGGLVVLGIVAMMMAEAQQQRTGFGKRGRGNADLPVPVLAAAAKLADVPVYLDGVGTTKALNTVTVRPQVDGKLLRVLFKEGQDVERGYVLAEIDPITYQALYDQAVAKKAQDEAQLANARLDLDRYNRLVATNSVTRQQADTQKAMVAQLEAQVRLDQAAIDNATAILGYTKIVAPITGRTGIRMVDEGNLIRAGDASTGVVVITQIRPLSVFFSLPQQQLGLVNRAFAKAPLPVEALGIDNKSVIDRGTLQVVDNQVDQQTGTVKLKAEFPNAELQLWPGQFVNVKLLVETLKQVVVVPTGAVQRGPNGTFVYVVKEDTSVGVRPVTVSQQDDVQAVIVSGLAVDERVVTTGFARISDGTKVAVSNADETPTPAATTEAPQQRRRRGGPKS